LVVVNGIASTSSSETESQPPNMPQTPPNSNASSSPNSNNNNAMQLYDYNEQSDNYYERQIFLDSNGDAWFY
ncbi:unnamed protein product, partial [Rotaria sp. Silwood2]